MDCGAVVKMSLVVCCSIDEAKVDSNCALERKKKESLGKGVWLLVENSCGNKGRGCPIHSRIEYVLCLHIYKFLMDGVIFKSHWECFSLM